MLLLPLARHFSENSTIDAVSSLIIWGLMWFVFVMALLVAVIGVVCHLVPDSLTYKQSLETVHEGFAKLRWWKTLMVYSAVMGVFVYVDWSGPAVLYTLNTILMWGGYLMIRAGVKKMMKEQGIEISDDEIKDVKKSILEDLKKSTL